MKIALVGYGAMGRIIENNIIEDKIVGIISEEFNNNLDDCKEIPNVIIDFSNPANLDMIYDYAKKNKVSVVFATTGFNNEQLEKIDDLGKYTNVLISANFSLGVMILNILVKEVAPILKDSCDIELIEKHHNKKIDAPSGTAKMLVNSMNESLGYNIVPGRNGVSKREKKEIGVHAVRGGTIVGEHEVIFAGTDEIISLKHEAFSKVIFAKGAIKGAKWIVNQETGIYNMEDVLFGKE